MESLWPTSRGLLMPNDGIVSIARLENEFEIHKSQLELNCYFPIGLGQLHEFEIWIQFEFT